MAKHIYVIFFFLFIGFCAKAQLSFDPNQFSTDLENYINKSGNPSAKDAVAGFVGYYTAGRFTNQQKIQIIRLSNELVNQNIGIRDFDNYLRSMIGLIESNQMTKFDNWHKAAQAALTKSKDAFSGFAQISRNLFQDHVVAEVGSMKWVMSNPEVEMDMKGEPGFLLKNTDLYCYTIGDTLTILNTSGKYFPSSQNWVGTGGSYQWTRVGMDSAKISAELKRYTIDFKTGTVNADTALLSYPALFEKPIPGKLLDKVMVQSQGDRSMYPQFQSFQRNFSGISFGKAKFTGGFGLKGKIIVGKGADSTRAELTFQYKKKVILKLLAKEFMVRDNKIGAKKAALVIYLEKDSIYHPQVEFTYRLGDDFVYLYRNDEGISMTPFLDSYHNIEFFCDEMKWDLNNPKIDLDMINDNEPAKFESINYFRDVRYEKVQGVLNYNPLQRIKLYCEKRNIKGFYIKDYAAAYKATESDIRIQMIDLNDKGYISLNLDNDYVTVKRKLQDYVNAHFGNTDYDAIAFYSIIKRYPNASISLINNDLQIQGVPKFYFSDSQNVYVVPENQLVTMKKDRNMNLSGKIRAGMVDFYGNGFTFDYRTFQVRLNNVDSMKFFYHDDITGADLPVKSALQNVYGTLLIDHPSNKSGRKKFPGYPIFKSDVGSKVYYDKPTTQKGAYDRTRFFFDVDPFTIDSLTDMSFESLSLPGTLLSGGIVPDLKYELTIQEDKSLGFKIPKNMNGYPLYGGKGIGFVQLSLSDEGFFGNGELRYVASTSESDKFIFLLDSMNSDAQKFTNDRTMYFPTAKATNIYEHWMPYHDTMFVSRKQEIISFSDNRATLDGTMIVTPQKMGAYGAVYVDQAQITSRDFWLKPDNVVADTSQFHLRNYNDTSKFAFYSGNVTTDVDLNARMGYFKFHTWDLNSVFDYNNYKGSFEQFVWNINDKKVDFKSYIRDGQEASYLLSTRPSQDSLQFTTGLSTLDIRDFTLYSKKIPFIHVGDASIYPDSQRVTIVANAEMNELAKAKIIADTAMKYHTLEDCTLKINGRFAVTGTGVYQYIDRNKNKQKFFMSEILVDEKHQLVGKTYIPDSANFYVGTKILFKGNAVLRSIWKNLQYDGYFFAQHTLPYPKTDWFKNAAIINPDSVYITVQPQLINPIRQALSVGLNVSNDSAHVYPSFFSRKRNGSDPEFVKVEGDLYYDDKSKLFKMGPNDKVFKNGLKGNYMELDEEKKTVYYEGRFKLGFDGGKFEAASAGYAKYSYADTSFKMVLTMLMNFGFPPQALKIMYDSLNDQSSSAPGAEFDKKLLTKGLAELLDDKSYKRIADDLNDNTINMISELQRTIFISHVEMKWNQPTRSFISVGDISVNSFDKYRLERKLGGRLEIAKRRAGDDFTLYLLSPGGSWYFFKYQRGILAVVGSDPLFNQYIKDNIDKLSKADDYQLRVANVGDRNKFVKAMKGK